MSSSSGFYFFDRSSNRSNNTSNPIINQHQQQQQHHHHHHHHNHTHTHHYQDKTNTSSSSLAIRNRKISKNIFSPLSLSHSNLFLPIEIVNFGDANFNNGSFSGASGGGAGNKAGNVTSITKGHNKTSSAASNAILNTTAPICITSLNGSAIATPAGHSRVPSASSTT